MLPRLLPYHWPMIADERRNGAYDEALRRAVRQVLKTQGTCDVLDVGAGSGLLAMMAARAGATSVSSAEMVPALAECAATITAANGYGDVVRVLARKSNDLRAPPGDRPKTRAQLAELRRAAAGPGSSRDVPLLPQKADILVSEILDNGLLGEGVVPATQDARERRRSGVPNGRPARASPPARRPSRERSSDQGGTRRDRRRERERGSPTGGPTRSREPRKVRRAARRVRPPQAPQARRHHHPEGRLPLGRAPRIPRAPDARQRLPTPRP